MKKACAFLLSVFLFTTHCFSQESSASVFHLNKIPPNGVVLDKGWKFQAGDDSAYVRPGYDDSQWENINPILEVDSQPQKARSGICWMRLHISMDSNLIDEQLVLIISQNVASEIYLNGRLIHKFGTINNNLKETIAFNPLGKIVSFPFDKSLKQVLALRFEVQPDIRYTNTFDANNSLVRLKINQIDAALGSFEYRWFQTGLPTSVVFRLGAFLILAILHLAFFLYYPSIKANLYFSLYAMIGFAADVMYFGYPNEVGRMFFVSSVNYFLYEADNLLLLTALYSLLQQKRGWIFWGVVVAVLLGFVLDITDYFRINWGLAVLSENVIGIVMVVTAFKGLRLKMKGAWIIVSGAICFSIFDIVWFLGLVNRFGGDPISYYYEVGDLFFNLTKLSIPIATSVYLALNFAFTSRALEQKLTEVELLSNEKQQILAGQNEMLEKEVSERTAALNHSLEELKITQKQLIHQEKMASLGELTAGIAHEIQNPLNFVNNFSEMNTELLGELKAEADKGNLTEVKLLADDVIKNEEKINHHGKRADGIVKGMLLHSRQTSGTKELTDINKLAEEYLGLAFHGLRAKDKNFNAEVKTDLDGSIGEIKLVRQDIGRVLLNLYNNAFYAVNEKRKTAPESHQPSVSVQTKRVDDRVEVRITDNGNGISKKLIDKIFQPFFTTKPAGQGTGLGLSLSYDVVKAHGGDIKVESREGEFTEFLITIPMG